MRRIVRELNAYDNVYFEIQNEPWASDQLTVRVLNPYLDKSELKQEGQFWKNRVDVASPASLAWQRRVADWVVDEEAAPAQAAPAVAGLHELLPRAGRRRSAACRYSIFTTRHPRRCA